MAEPDLVLPDPQQPYAANHEIRLLNLDTGRFCRTYDTVRGARAAANMPVWLDAPGRPRARLAVVKVLVTVVERFGEYGGG